MGVFITHYLQMYTVLNNWKRDFKSRFQLFYCVFGLEWKIKIILLFSLFLLLFMTSLYFLVLFMGLTVLFQLTFTFIYNIFSNKFSVSAK